jgi:peroxiredoxin
MFFPFSTLIVALLMGGGFDQVPSGANPRPSPTASHLSFMSEPPVTEVQVGDPAPNFSYQGFDGRWMRLHHLVDQGPVLLVFGLNDNQLGAIEHERDGLLGLGVIPVAIVDRRPGQARDLVRRLNLKYTVLADSRQVIASQFNATDLGRVTPSWFVIDARLRVRSLSRGRTPPDDYVRLCARALALPIPGNLMPASR